MFNQTKNLLRKYEKNKCDERKETTKIERRKKKQQKYVQRMRSAQMEEAHQKKIIIMN